MRSLARAFPRRGGRRRSASKRCSSMASSSVTVWWPLRLSSGCDRRTVPFADGVFQVAHHEALAHLVYATRRSRNSITSGEVVAGVHVQQREGQAAFGNRRARAAILKAFRPRCSTTQNPCCWRTAGRALESGGGSAQDEDGLPFQGVEGGVHLEPAAGDVTDGSAGRSCQGSSDRVRDQVRFIREGRPRRAS